MPSIVVSTLWLLVVVIGTVLITGRLTQHLFLSRRPILLGLVIGLSWLATLESWVLVTILLAPTDAWQVLLVVSEFVALAASCVFALAAVIAVAVRQSA